jgi:hypothetical protein
LNHQLNTTSSGGLQFDNSVLMTLPAGDLKSLSFTGDRIGLYHPSVSAPGTNIVSTGTTGAAVTTTPGGTATATGTSMATPHVAGVAALMLQRNPNLSPDEVKSALQVTSTLMPDLTDSALVQPFYQVGYGYVDAKSAVDLVSRARYDAKTLARFQSKADQVVLGDRDDSILRTDYWTFTAAPATVSGTPDNRTFTFNVTSTTKSIKALVSYPSLGYVGLNPFNYQLTITDAAGKTIATTTPASNAGMSQVFVDIPPNAVFGTWSVNVYGDLGAQDQDTIMGVLVSVAVHQLKPQKAVTPKMPTFTPSGTLTYFLTPGTAGALTSPEGCNLQAGTPVAGLSTARATGTCQSGSMGYALNYGASIPAFFNSAPLAAPLTVGGTMTIKFYLTDPVQPVWNATTFPRLGVEVDAVDDAGNLLLAIAAADLQVCSTDTSGNKVCNTGPQPVGGTYTMSIPPITIPAGARLSVVFRETAAVTSSSRTVYGGRGLSADFSDAGVTFTTGTLQ